MQKRKQLTLSNQTFSNIREEGTNTVYVDKTEHIYNLVTNGVKQKIFLSRPRRFGKSLLCSTLKSLFKGEKEYFYDTYIEDRWDWDKKHPVIHIMFGTGVVEDKEYLKDQLEDIIIYNCENNNFDINSLPQKTIGGKFQALIKKLYEKNGQKVVILIDEYDKPILDRIHKPEIAVEIREELKSFYSAIKNSDDCLRFVFITGVSKFSQVSLFSGLNQLNDITFNQSYATICGYTKQEIIDSYGTEGYLDGVDLERLKYWYNGYNFNSQTEEEKVYNPYGLLNFFNNHNEYINYWFKSATPTFLINLLKKNNFPIIDFEKIEVNQEIMDSFELENLDIITLMFQTGYLTIKEKNILGNLTEYTLGIPNFEVRQSLNDYLVKYYFGFENKRENFDKIRSFHKSLGSGDIEKFINTIKSVFSGIPYNNYTKNDISKYEGFYSSVIYSFLTGAGLEFISEDTMNYGRIDFTLKYGDYVYIIELKTEKTGEEAFKQIKSKGYEKKYLQDGKKIFLIGINFDEELRNVESWKFEELEN